jgi:mevalonate kinase
LNKVVTASAPGKIILTGEHFVVHGSYAVAAAINKRVRVSVRHVENGSSSIVSGEVQSKMDSNDGKFPAAKTVARKIISEFGREKDDVEVSIKSEIPAGSGLGSSAAVSVACASAMTKYFGARLEPENLFTLAMSGEKQVHGNPSGIDIEASLRGGMILFSRKTGAKSIKIRKSIQLVVIYSGKKRRTSKLVSDVALRKESYPKFFQHLTDSASFQSLEVTDACIHGD